MAGDAAVDGAVVTVVGPVAAVDAAALVVAVVDGDDAVEVVPATTGTDVVDGVEPTGEPDPIEGEGDGAVLCARSDATAMTRMTKMTRLRKEPMESSWEKRTSEMIEPPDVEPAVRESEVAKRQEGRGWKKNLAAGPVVGRR